MCYDVSEPLCSVVQMLLITMTLKLPVQAPAVAVARHLSQKHTFAVTCELISRQSRKLATCFAWRLVTSHKQMKTNEDSKEFLQKCWGCMQINLDLKETAAVAQLGRKKNSYIGLMWHDKTPSMHHSS